MWPWSQVSSCSLLPPVLSKCHLLSLYESAAYLLAAVDRAIAHIWFLSQRILRTSNFSSPAFFYGSGYIIQIDWMREAHTLSSQATLPVHLPGITICVLERMSCTFIVEPCTCSSNRQHSYFSSPRIMWPSIQRGLLPSSLGRIWTKLAFLRSSGICGDESNYYENKVACVMCVCAIQNLRFMWSDAARHPNAFWKISCLWVDSWNWAWCKAVESFICIWLKLPTAWRSLLN